MLGLLIVPLVVTLAVAFSLWPWTAIYHRRPTVRILATLIGTSVAIVWLQLILGWFAALTPVMLRTSAAGLAVLSLALFLLFGRRAIAAPPDRFASPTVIGVGLGLVTAAVYAWLGWVGTLIPPYGWDAMTYHLTDILHFARSHTVSVFPLIHSPGLQTHFFFPQVGELHASWFYILSGGVDESYRVAAYGLMPLALTAAVATRAAVEALEWKLVLPFIVPGIMLTPALVAQPLGLSVDVTFAAFVLSSFAFAVWAERESRFAHLAFVALAGGLAFGVKVSFLYFFLPIAAVLLSTRVVRTVTEGGLRRTTARVLLLLALFAAPCGYWFVRNAVTTGNPLWPTRVTVAGVTVFKGPVEIPRGTQTTRFVTKSSDWILYPFYETYEGKSRYTDNGFGALFAAGYVATLFMFLLALRRGAWHVARPLLALPLTIAPFLLVSPTSEPRFVIASVGFGLLALAGLVEVIGKGTRLPLQEKKVDDTTRWSGDQRFPLWLAQSGMAVAIVFGAMGCLVTAAPHLEDVLPSWRAGTWQPTHYYSTYYGTAGDAFNWMTTHGGSGVTFTFTNATFIAPVLGFHNRNRVVQAAIEGQRRVIEAEEIPTYEAWREFLRREKVTYVAVWVPWWDEAHIPVTEQWIADNPEDFAVVADFERARIYRPVWGAVRAARSGAPLDLPLLSAVDSWKLEYKTGAESGIEPDPAGGIRFSYAFTTPQADYCDWRAQTAVTDWSPYAALSFDLSSPPASTYLMIYIKGPAGHGSMRFRKDLSTASGTQRVELPFGRPEKQSPDFKLSNVGAVHLILDDVVDEQNNGGEIVVSRFRLEPRRPPVTPAEFLAARKSAGRNNP